MFRHSIAETGLTKATCELSLSDFPLTTTVFFWYNNPMFCGGMAEWSNAAVLKTVVAQVTVGSNPTPTAIIPKYGGVQEWIRASDYGSEGRGFESSQALMSL